MVEGLKQLLALTADARKSARDGNFADLEVLIGQRQEVLNQINSRRQMPFNDIQKKLVQEITLCITELDEEIVQLVREEMNRESQDMLEIANKLRVLAAYSRSHLRNRRFDRIL